MDQWNNECHMRLQVIHGGRRFGRLMAARLATAQFWKNLEKLEQCESPPFRMCDLIITQDECIPSEDVFEQEYLAHFLEET